jgi:hypothetical protein
MSLPAPAERITERPATRREWCLELEPMSLAGEALVGGIGIVLTVPADQD